MPTAETVTVACKLPHGLICRIFVMREKTELVLGGGTRQVKEAVDSGRRFTINGVAHEAGRMPMSRRYDGAPMDGTQAPMLDTGFALTHNVPKADWDEWLEQNKDSDFIKKGLVFAHKQAASVKKQGKDHERIRTGLEPIDPLRPGNGVEIADEQKKRGLAA